MGEANGMRGIGGALSWIFWGVALWARGTVAMADL